MPDDNSISILIVEDDETLQETLAYNLEREGYTVITAMDGPSGLDLARTQPPDLIVGIGEHPRIDLHHADGDVRQRGGHTIAVQHHGNSQQHGQAHGLA